MLHLILGEGGRIKVDCGDVVCLSGCPPHLHVHGLHARYVLYMCPSQQCCLVIETVGEKVHIIMMMRKMFPACARHFV